MVANSYKVTSPISWLGHSPKNAEFDTWLTKNRIYDRPHEDIDDEEFGRDAYAAKHNAENSQIERAEHLGLCLIYVRKKNYERLFGKPESDGDFILKELVFYAQGVQDYQGYSLEPLPSNLRFGMRPSQVREVLGNHCGKRELHGSVCERFVIDNKFIVNVTYIDDAVGIVHLRAAHIYDQKSLPVEGLKVVRLPKPKFEVTQLTPFLGCDAMDADLDAFTTKLGWSSNGVDLNDCHEIMELIESAGLTLYYRQAKEIKNFAPKEKTSTLPSTIFVGFRVNRCGDMDSAGYTGSMPYGIEFFDTPKQMIEKIGKNPIKEGVAEDTGYYMWLLKEGIVHAMFSLIDLQLYRLTIFAPIISHEFKV
jgi:hypothetical protein